MPATGDGKLEQSRRDLIDFKKYCREVNDFPKKGVIFKDITTLLLDGKIFRQAINKIAERYAGSKVDKIACIDARGFLIGSALAYSLNCGLIPVRKKGKLPWRVHSQIYDLEYGQDTLEIHQDAILPGENVLIVDDVLATGGTAEAVVSLVKAMQGKLIGIAFLLEIKALKGRSKLPGENIFSLIES
jgi:adenine phosphoribosyltransferase